MDSKHFKNVFNACMLSNGFLKNGGYYYQNTAEIICSIGLQKSNYSNGFYVNVGYIIKVINTGLTTPRDVDGDLRTRFSININGKIIDIFDLSIIRNENELSKQILDNLNALVVGYLSYEGLRNLVKQDPSLLYQMKAPAKKFLGYDLS
ncbi:MAG: DUF4304 domain-containing protein [Candidatus Omnitrophica bacterium]|nr:DUF4304 domain-containing protein [Candidatus Omnitrophota bacterium]